MDGDYEGEMIKTITGGLRMLASSITPPEALGTRDASGGHVESLTEAVMGVTAGLVRIAESIEDLAEAVRERG